MKLGFKERLNRFTAHLRQRVRIALFVLIVLGLVGGSALALYRLSDAELWPIEVILIEGDLAHLPPEKLRNSVLDSLKEGYFTASLVDLKQHIEAQPWIAQVTLRRRWPNALQVGVVERQPLARWGEKHLIDREGNVFAPDAREIPAGLALLIGPAEHSDRVARFYQASMPQLSRLGLEIDAISLTKEFEWRLRLNNNLLLILGRDQKGERLARFIQLYPNLVAERDQLPERIDMRYEHGLAVKWIPRDEKAQATQAKAADIQVNLTATEGDKRRT